MRCHRHNALRILPDVISRLQKFAIARRVYRFTNEAEGEKQLRFEKFQFEIAKQLRLQKFVIAQLIYR